MVTSEALSGGDEQERHVIERLLDALEFVALLSATIVTRNAADFDRFGVPVPGYGAERQASAGTKRGSTR